MENHRCDKMRVAWSLNHPHRKQAKDNNPDALQNSNDGDEKQWNLNIADSTGIFCSANFNN